MIIITPTSQPHLAHPSPSFIRIYAVCRRNLSGFLPFVPPGRACLPAGDLVSSGWESMTRTGGDSRELDLPLSAVFMLWWNRVGCLLFPNHRHIEIPRPSGNVAHALAPERRLRSGRRFPWR
jgi:hypothetical protein